jgi:hypothetical protein
MATRGRPSTTTMKRFAATPGPETIDESVGGMKQVHHHRNARNANGQKVPSRDVDL